jgi:hypothetical protein
MVSTEPTDLGNVNVMLDALRDELVRTGYSEQALQLKGLELFGDGVAEVALSTLEGMEELPQVASSIRDSLIGMLQSFIRARRQAA